MKLSIFVVSGATCAGFAFSAAAAPLLAPGDFILGGRLDTGLNQFEVGAVGTDGGGGVYTDNVWPAAEPPANAINNAVGKYLNFAELNTGLLITPASPSIATSLQLWTANDSAARDPASYSLYGTNEPISGNGPFALTSFALISSGPLSLPPDRNTTTTGLVFSQTVPFTNAVPYSSYLLVFPTVKDEPATNSMQIAEVQLDGTVVPEPSTVGLLGLAALGLGASRRRRS